MKLQIKLEAAEKEISSLKSDKEDYKQRLNNESEERRKLMMLISDMRDRPPQKPVERQRKFLGIFPYKNR